MTSEMIAALRKQGARRERSEIRALLRRWKARYTPILFPEPRPGQHGKTVDGCSARAVRQVLGEILKDIRKREVE